MGLFGDSKEEIVEGVIDNSLENVPQVELGGQIDVSTSAIIHFEATKETIDSRPSGYRKKKL